ncbi:MAG: SLBB domain-containing protein [Capsulimonadaceae bacterium]|nr:SLBB domain-containing protein [Capsulimonadaceae bacterium]
MKRRVVLSVSMLAVAATVTAVAVRPDPRDISNTPNQSNVQTTPVDQSTERPAADPNYIPVDPNAPRSPKPSNPLILQDYNNRTTNPAAYYANKTNTAPRLPESRNGDGNPDANSPFTDPALRNTPRGKGFLPLFGYDFFSATRQLISARRLALQRQFMPPPVYAPQRQQRQYTGTPDTTATTGLRSPYATSDTLIPEISQREPYDATQNSAAQQYRGLSTPGNNQSAYAVDATGRQTTGSDSADITNQTSAAQSAGTLGQTDQTATSRDQDSAQGDNAQSFMRTTPQATQRQPSSQSQTSGIPQNNSAPGAYDMPQRPYQPAASGAYAPAAFDQTIPTLDPYYYQTHDATAQQNVPPGSARYSYANPQVVQQPPYSAATTSVAQGQDRGQNPVAPGNELTNQSGTAVMNGAASLSQPQGVAQTTAPYYDQSQSIVQPQSGAQTQAYAPQTAQSSIDAYHEIADPLSQLFRNVQQSLPPNYQLNPGDTVTIRVWSPTIPMREFTRTIDSRGMVYLTDIGAQVIRGLSAAQVENQLRAKLQRVYRGMDVAVTLSELRTMTVTVSGEAFAPGTYTVPAGTSAFNLLYAAGGPTLEGSLRRIEVRRNGLIAGEVDLYGFILGGGDKADISLQPGDIIYIPQRVSRVSVRGEVRHPAIYEVKDDESLADVVKFAGGVKPSGVGQRIELNTFQPGAARLIKDVDLVDNNAQKATPVYDGDNVEVFSVRNIIMNRVTVDGAVDQPGDYALTPGMRVSDLILRARGPVEDAYTTRADLYRWNEDNTLTLLPIDIEKALEHDTASDVALARWDRIHVYTREEVSWTGRREVTVRGAVQRPGSYYRSDNMHAKDLLLQAGGTLSDAYLDRAVLLHQRPDGSFSYDYISIAETLKDGGDAGPEIKDNDILAVYKTGEAQFTPDHMVTIRGRVNAPGVYPRGEGMRLHDILQLAGGYTQGAGFQVMVTHPARITENGSGAGAGSQSTIMVNLDSQRNLPATKDVLLLDGDVVTVQGIGGIYTSVRVVTIGGAVARPGPVPITPTMRISDAVKLAGGLLPAAYPNGAEFVRNPTFMTTATQQSITETIKRLNDLLNQSEYRREQARSDVERLQAIQSGGSSTVAAPAALGGLLGGAASTSSNPLPAGATNNLQQRELVSQARILTPQELVPNGNLAINLGAALEHPGGRDDLPLMDGDTITVPERPTSVQVIGAVFNSRGVLFAPGKTINYYIDQAGGFSPDAAQDRIEIIHIGGGLVKAYKSYSLQPGDVILVPTKVLAASIEKHRSAWSDALGQLSNVAIVIAVLNKLL